MVLRMLKGRGIVSGIFEKKQVATPPHQAPPKALPVTLYTYGHGAGMV
jgi:hypothetical protein